MLEWQNKLLTRRKERKGKLSRKQVVANAKASAASKMAAMARARKTAQIAEICQSRANLEFVSVHSGDTIARLPAQM